MSRTSRPASHAITAAEAAVFPIAQKELSNQKSMRLHRFASISWRPFGDPPPTTPGPSPTWPDRRPSGTQTLNHAWSGRQQCTEYHTMRLSDLLGDPQHMHGPYLNIETRSPAF
jgi:hypothetical protein